MMRSKTAAFALAASFSIYLIPLIGPHAMFFVGEVLFQGEARRSPKWMAVNCAAALLFQLLAAGLFHWFFSRPVWRRGIVMLVALPFFFLTMESVYLVAIPTMFLEEADTAPEGVSWPLACSAPGVYQTDLRTHSELWVRSNVSPNNYAVLTMPGCRLAAVNLPQPTYKPGTGVDFSIEITSIAFGGRALVRKDHPKEARQSWWLIPGAPMESAASLVPLESPEGHSSGSAAPILSTDGQWAAWLEAIPNTGPPVFNRVLIRPLDPRAKEKIVDLSALGAATYSLQKLDMQSEELMLWQTDRLISAGFDGARKKEFTRPPTARAQQNTYVAMADYWLAWDAYRENGPYVIEWSLPSGSGSNRIPRGRLIHSAAVDAAGKWIAVSVGTGLNIGKAQDSVYVLGAANGREVFRKYLPRYSRSPVAFLDGGFLAYSDLSGMHALRIPE